MTPQADTRAAMLSALAWQVELGADEAIADTPVDRFAPLATSAPAPPAKQPEAAAPRARNTSAPETPDARPAPPQPHAADVARAATSLEDLATALQDWDGSPLKAGARNFVFSDGNPAARLMVIGEAPGADEDRQGKPFVGRAGEFLDRMLAAIGLDRTADTADSAVYITNFLPWRPPGNRAPTDLEAALFLPFIERHIALAKPDVILTMGNTPTKALLATSTGIKRSRGAWGRHGPSGIPVLPSFHPDHLLRQAGDKRLAWRDLLAIRGFLDGGELPV